MRCTDLTEFGTYASALKCSNCREGLILPENLDLSKTTTKHDDFKKSIGRQLINEKTTLSIINY